MVSQPLTLLVLAACLSCVAAGRRKIGTVPAPLVLDDGEEVHSYMDTIYVAPPAPVANARVAIIGSGNWGSAVAKIVSENVKRSELFDQAVSMYVFDEVITDDSGKAYNLSAYINEHHENIKYLKGVTLPENLVAEPDLVKSVQGADVLVWLAPHQFVLKQARDIKDHIKPTAVSVSLIKGGFDIEGTKPKLLSEQIRQTLGRNHPEVSVLMGANLAGEVGEGKFAEATLGCRGARKLGQLSCEQVKTAFNGPKFRVDVVPDIEAVEISGSLKNVVALAAGFADSLNSGNNAKAAIVRHGLLEIKAFVHHFYPQTKDSTYFESAGLADLVTTCYGGRNRKCAEAFGRARSSPGIEPCWDAIARELLNGQKLQGTLTTEEVIPIIVANGLEAVMPLHVAVHGIAFKGLAPETLFDALASA